ncbi:MAG: nitroreductase family deazaflavin-dependent oxidoreductase [Acidimicrobiia bacterium]|nr:nitroreductase family deazaflavin-dependent oxidoreductase [Acidimicrobiia bacterium]
MRDRTAKHLSTLHTLLYRATRGRIGRRLVDNDMLLLTTTGHTTGKKHTVPLLYLDTGSSLIVIASWGGRPTNPHWYQNLLANPRAQVRLPDRRFQAVARTAAPQERLLWWPRIVDAYDGYATYQSRSDREIPVVFLEDTAPGRIR